MRTTVREPSSNLVLNPVQAESLRNLVHKLEAINFSGIQKDLGKFEEETAAVDVLICSSNCLGY